MKKRGVNFIGNCPFHDEKTPSFTVSPAKGIYKCFGCGKGGFSVNFVMEHEQMDFPSALRFLAKKYNIEVEERKLTPEELEKSNKERQAIELMLSEQINIKAKNYHNHPVLVLSGDSWHEVIIGIVASRIKEKYNKPTILISINGELPLLYFPQLVMKKLIKFG